MPFPHKSKNGDFLALPETLQSNNIYLSFGHATGTHPSDLLNFSHNILLISLIPLRKTSINLTASRYIQFDPNMSQRY